MECDPHLLLDRTPMVARPHLHTQHYLRHAGKMFRHDPPQAIALRVHKRRQCALVAKNLDHLVASPVRLENLTYLPIHLTPLHASQIHAERDEILILQSFPVTANCLTLKRRRRGRRGGDVSVDIASVGKERNQIASWISSIN
jgi:hypothetical protein